MFIYYDDQKLGNIKDEFNRRVLKHIHERNILQRRIKICYQICRKLDGVFGLKQLKSWQCATIKNQHYSKILK